MTETDWHREEVFAISKKSLYKIVCNTCMVHFPGDRLPAYQTCGDPPAPVLPLQHWADLAPPVCQVGVQNAFLVYAALLHVGIQA